VIEHLPSIQSLLDKLPRYREHRQNEKAMKQMSFAGTIRTTTRDGRSGVVVLDESVRVACGKQFAVISPDTLGRVALMNGVGQLQAGTHVRGTAEVGSEALRALSVKAD
jgi:hypothetical protein